jgi:hypothetical protein
MACSINFMVEADSEEELRESRQTETGFKSIAVGQASRVEHEEWAIGGGACESRQVFDEGKRVGRMRDKERANRTRGRGCVGG